MQGCMKSFFREDRDIHRQRGVSIKNWLKSQPAGTGLTTFP